MLYLVLFFKIFSKFHRDYEGDNKEEIAHLLGQIRVYSEELKSLRVERDSLIEELISLRKSKNGKAD